MSAGTLLTDAGSADVAEAAAQLRTCRLELRKGDDLVAAIDSVPDLRAIVLTTDNPTLQRLAVDRARARHVPIVMACADETARRRAVELRVEEWYRVPAPPEEIAWRIHSAMGRVAPSGSELASRVAQVEYEEMLFDTLTGLPTLPVMIERTRAAFKERGEMAVLYLHFVRYSKLEEIYGWEKLDGVLETTAAAVREFLDQNRLRSTQMMVSFANDDDFVFFHVPAEGRSAADANLSDIAARLQEHVGARLEAGHGEEIAALVDVYVGTAHVYNNPKIRLERIIYRGIREAVNAAKGVEERERGRKVSALRETLHNGGVYIDYHPIVLADTEAVFGYEALARGVMRSLRSPEVMFEVAAEADLVWELSRLCRRRAVEEMDTRLGPDHLLFMNVDPHDFADPMLVGLDVRDPRRVVIEITERTAIKDYPKLRERLQGFRDRGFRIAVDDAGSGYAGLGSIANLEPDFIKLDISLINCIDTNFIKQNLVETMVRFAEDHGAKVIAEGVERAEELDTVRRLGVHLVQGFFLHRPGRLGVAAPRREDAKR
ncbi:MAG: EAL domain-containing protein [Gemmatimonadota bacterium]|nr:EAL domain-containing protein [Gemmatimonadota bacterium]